MISRQTAKKLSILFLLFSFIFIVQAVDPVTPIRNAVCTLYCGVEAIAYPLGVCVFLLAGLKWIASGEDAGKRKQAKDTMIHVIIGVLIVTLAYEIVSIVLSFSACSC